MRPAHPAPRPHPQWSPSASSPRCLPETPPGEVTHLAGDRPGRCSGAVVGDGDRLDRSGGAPVVTVVHAFRHADLTVAVDRPHELAGLDDLGDGDADGLAVGARGEAVVDRRSGSAPCAAASPRSRWCSRTRRCRRRDTALIQLVGHAPQTRAAVVFCGVPDAGVYTTSLKSGVLGEAGRVGRRHPAQVGDGDVVDRRVRARPVWVYPSTFATASPTPSVPTVIDRVGDDDGRGTAVHVERHRTGERDGRRARRRIDRAGATGPDAPSGGSGSRQHRSALHLSAKVGVTPFRTIDNVVGRRVVGRLVAERATRREVVTRTRRRTARCRAPPTRTWRS